MTATVNCNASGTWAANEGKTVEVVGPGLNKYHVIARWPGERKTFALPTRWLDMEE